MTTKEELNRVKAVMMYELGDMKNRAIDRYNTSIESLEFCRKQIEKGHEEARERAVYYTGKRNACENSLRDIEYFIKVIENEFNKFIDDYDD